MKDDIYDVWVRELRLWFNRNIISTLDAEIIMKRLLKQIEERRKERENKT